MIRSQKHVTALASQTMKRCDSNPSAIQRKLVGCFCAGLVMVLTMTRLAIADTPSPAPTSSPPAAANAPPPIPKNFDPCGGFLELLNKIGNGTACVFVRGEGAVTAQYGSAYIPVNSQVNFQTPAGSRNFGLSPAGSAFGYPGSTIYIGVLPRAQVAITLPSFVQVNSSFVDPLTGTHVLAAGATNMKFQYKQLAYVNLKTSTTAAFDVEYNAPTGSLALRGPGPSYTINPMATQPLPLNFGFTIASPVINSTINNPLLCSRGVSGFVCTSGGTQRGWSWTPQLVPYWESRGGTLLAVVVQHGFRPNVTPFVFSAAQLFGRHLEISAAYGGFTYSAFRTGPFQDLATASTTADPSLFTIGVNYLIGHSDLPAALQQ